jgi:dynein heavy chain
MSKLPAPYESQKVIMSLINPKSVTIHQLYGVFEVETKNWIEGILSKIMRD